MVFAGDFIFDLRNVTSSFDIGGRDSGPAPKVPDLSQWRVVLNFEKKEQTTIFPCVSSEESLVVSLGTFIV